MVKREFNEAESYGWVVNDWEATEAYDFACDYFGKEELDSQIVRCLGDEELAKCLAFIFRMNEFDEWENRDNEDEFDESIKRNNRRMKEDYKLPYVLWVLDGDSKQWEMYKGITDAKKFIQENDWEEFLDALNKQVFPNETYYNNYIDWVVLPAGQHPKDGGTNKFYGEIMPKYESTKSIKRESRRRRRRINERVTNGGVGFDDVSSGIRPTKLGYEVGEYVPDIGYQTFSKTCGDFDVIIYDVDGEYGYTVYVNPKRGNVDFNWLENELSDIDFTNENALAELDDRLMALSGNGATSYGESRQRRTRRSKVRTESVRRNRKFRRK